MKALRTLPLAMVGLPLATFGGCASEDPAAPSLDTSGTVTATGDSTGNGTASTTGSGTVTSTTGSGTVTSTTGSGTVTSTTGSGTVTSTTGSGTATATVTSSSSTGGTSTSTATGTGGMSGTITSTVTGGGGSTGSTETATTGTVGPTLEDLVGDLDGRLIQTPCGDNPNTDDCSGAGWITDGSMTGCSGGSLDAQVVHEIGGEPGAMYDVTFHFYGIAEPKNYGNGVTREAGNQAANRDGQSPLAWATAPAGHEYPSSNYNTYEIRVRDQGDNEVGVYYLNSDTSEGHWTMIINYEKTIPLVGGGSVLVRVFDLNCRQIKNCGAQGGAPCDNKARTVDIGAADPQPVMGNPPQGFTQPGLGEPVGHSGQWVLIDAISFTDG